jgi:hypothetical protein
MASPANPLPLQDYYQLQWQKKRKDPERAVRSFRNACPGKKEPAKTK